MNRFCDESAWGEVRLAENAEACHQEMSSASYLEEMVYRVTWGIAGKIDATATYHSGVKILQIRRLGDN